MVVMILAVEFSGPSWQSKSASEKHSTIWARLASDQTSGAFPFPVKLLKLFVENMDISFDTDSDDFPYQGPFGVERREKLIHSVGVVGQVVFKGFKNHSYTGLYKGANYGIIRWSWASAANPLSEYPFLPGVAFKFFRDGMKSTNLFTMTSLVGSETPNIFRYDVSNHIPDLYENTIDPKLLLLRKTFSKASAWPGFVALSDFARYNEDGTEVAKPVFPYRLIFHPPPEIRTLMDNGATKTETEFAKFFLSNLNKPVPLIYSVWAEAEPNAPSQKIGELELKSAPISSQYSDTQLFFQHNRFELDLAYRPDWEALGRAQLKEQSKSERYIYPQQSD